MCQYQQKDMVFIPQRKGLTNGFEPVVEDWHAKVYLSLLLLGLGKQKEKKPSWVEKIMCMYK